MFYFQLIHEFGFDTLLSVFESYKDDQDHDPATRPSTITEKEDQWLIRYSTITNFDMTQFMVGTWKLEVSNEAKRIVENMNLSTWMPYGM
mmetsp:Transcript_8651/g.13513  ORF Transcript_8651/g.13513 Transcript_8651/m.13513 type:complete len:90 (-) Transcript_8651:100-369(-)